MYDFLSNVRNICRNLCMHLKIVGELIHLFTFCTPSSSKILSDIKITHEALTPDMMRP